MTDTSRTSKDVALLCCPFCGSDRAQVVRSFIDRDSNIAHCPQCDACGPRALSTEPAGTAEARWNAGRSAVETTDLQTCPTCGSSRNARLEIEWLRHDVERLTASLTAEVNAVEPRGDQHVCGDGIVLSGTRAQCPSCREDDPGLRRDFTMCECGHVAIKHVIGQQSCMETNCPCTQMRPVKASGCTCGTGNRPGAIHTSECALLRAYR